MQEKAIYRPSNIAPDKDSAIIGTAEGKRASNMRIGNLNPTRGDVPVDTLNSGIYKVHGNTEIPNSLLPAGNNKCLGWVQEESTDRLVFANYNSEGQSAIYEYRSGSFSKVVSIPDFVLDSEVDMTIRGDILAFTDDIQEPRVVNIKKGIDGLYENFQPWMLAQLHRRPAFQLQINGNIEQSVADVIPKPSDLYPLQAYQFGYNYEYIDNIESRISDPTRMVWANNITLTVPQSEIDNYILMNGQPNAYIVAVKFYYRIGNSGGWNLFRRVKNDNNWNRTVTVGLLTELVNIGGTTASALALVDGIGRRVKNNYFADNRLIHAGIFTGYDIDLPEVVATVEQDSTSLEDRKYRIFPPIKNQCDVAVVYFDEYDRVIGGRAIPSLEMFSNQSQYKVDLLNVYNNAGAVFLNADWEDVVDYGLVSNLNSERDINNRNRIDITHGADVPLNPAIKKAVLATRSAGQILSFLRTIARPYWIFKDKDGNFLPYTYLPFDLEGGFRPRSTSTINNILYDFYGIGFEFLSGEPISFSTEQNFFIDVLGLTYSTDITIGLTETVITEPAKVTDQFGSILICKLDYQTVLAQSLNKVRPFSRSIFNETPPESYSKFNHTICDIALYSKITAPVTWDLVPSVTWTASEIESQATKSYYGPAYASKFRSSLGSVNRRAIVINDIADETDIQDYWKVLTPTSWTGFFASMNLNGNFIQNWDKDFGQQVAVEEDPSSLNLQNSLRHGGQALSNTKINNLFSFDPQNEETVSSQLGPITRVQSLALDSTSGENLHIVCKLGSVAMFLGRVLVQDNSGNSTLATSTKVFGSKNVYQQKFGASKLYDVVSTDKGLLFFYDNIKKALCQISNNGVDVISEQKFFKSDTNSVIDQTDSHIGYDPFFMEVLVSQAKGEGLAYNFKQDVYQGKRFFGGKNPSEKFAYLADKAYSFYNGRLFLLNSNAETTFNDEPYRAKLVVVCNSKLTENKDFQFVVFKSSAGKKWRFALYSDNGFQTSIDTQEFIDRKDYYEASIKRAENSVGGKFNGSFMDAAIMTIEISDFDNDKKDLIFVEVGYSTAITSS